MTLYICKNVISRSLNNFSYLYKPHVSLSLSLFFFSSSREDHPNHTVAVADYLLERHQFSPETASKVSSVVAYLKNPEKSDSVLSFLEETGFSKIHLEQIIKSVPEVLSANVDHTIKPKIKVFYDLGFSPSDIAEIISADPWILKRSTNRLGPSILALKNVLDSNVGVSRILKLSGWFLKQDLEKTMVPNIEFMLSCGIRSSQITKFIYNFPRFLLHKPESVKEFVRKVDEMGFDRKSGMFLHAIRVISSMSEETWELKLDLFRSLGFSEDDILSVFRRMPQVFAVSEKKIKETTKLLLSTGKFDISFIISHAELLLCSVEQRLKPRLRVLELLERKNLLLRKVSISTACKITDKKFFEKYVFPYSKEVGEVFMVNKGS